MKLGETTIKREEGKEGEVIVSEDMYALASAINHLADAVIRLAGKMK